MDLISGNSWVSPGGKAHTFVYTAVPQASNCGGVMLLVAVESPTEAFTPKSSLVDTECRWPTVAHFETFMAPSPRWHQGAL
jgi:hypothetical protein